MTKRENRILSWLVSLIIIFLAAGCASTPKTEEVEEASCSERKRQIEPRAEAGDAKAQYEMGTWYTTSCGKWKEYDLGKAAEWFHRAAEQGHLAAMKKTANMYFYGWGVEKDYTRAEEWYRAVAEQGEAAAQVRLAAFYRNTMRDVDKATLWYRRAADQGDISAIRALGRLYLEGEEVEKDLDEAEKWYRLAQERDDWGASLKLQQIMKEKNPEAWEREQKALESETRKQLAEKEAQERIQRREETRKAAKQAKARLGLVSFSVRENEKSKRSRLAARWKLGSLNEPRVFAPDSSEFMEIAIGGLFYIGLAAPIVALMYSGAEEVKKGVKTRKEKVKIEKEKAKLRPALENLIKTFSQANLEGDFSKELLATAARQQAPSLLISGPDNPASTASHHLNIQLKELRMIAVSSHWDTARLWAVVEATLSNRTGGTDFEKRLCYGSESFSIEAVAEDIRVFKQQLKTVYRGLSSQILAEGLGLAQDRDTPSAWAGTAKFCFYATEATKVAGGMYIGGMRDGKPHGRGEIRYRPPKDWVSVYVGQFVNGKEHGKGRCKWANGGWGKCKFINGTRKWYQ